MTDTICAQRKGGVYAITLNRPEAGNAVSDSMIVQLGDLLEAVDSTVRVITLEGAGSDFCVGGFVRRLVCVDRKAMPAKILSIGQRPHATPAKILPIGQRPDMSLMTRADCPPSTA